jgi:SAM-dependent MidA family methyltransferase
MRGGKSVRCRAQLRCDFPQNPNRKTPSAEILQTGDPALIEWMRAQLRADGPKPFAWFMEQALYHPQHGYYSSGRCAIGRRGDFFTNVSVGPLFGKLLAAQIEEMWDALGRPGDFTIVEQGAHDGALALDLLGALRCEVRYVIVEPFAILRERQRAKLGDFSGRVQWRESIVALEPFTGVHLSNELLDAMPVHLVAKQSEAAAWQEKFVAESAEGFALIDQPIASEALARSLEKISLLPDVPYLTEVNLAAQAWMDQLATKLRRGFVLVIDYGFSRDQYYAPHRTSGTLRCFSQHRRSETPLENVGLADITAHVDWTSLAEQAEASGLHLTGFTDQHHFITGLLAADAPGAGRLTSSENARALQTLLHPNFLGMTFQYLVLTRDVEQSVQLSGLQFAADAHSQLGLRDS